MAVNQAQVDHIISTASADDPEVKLLKLQDEVDLIKTSIKKLLIDIRERMNDLENPIMMGMGHGGGEGYGDDQASSRVASMLRDTSSAVESAAGALKASSDAKKAEESEKAKAEIPAESTGPAETAAYRHNRRSRARQPGKISRASSISCRHSGHNSLQCPKRSDTRDIVRQGPAAEGLPAL